MWLLIWAALLLSPTDRTTCQAYPEGWSLTLSPAEITAETGLCAVISCSFTHPGSFTPKNAVWYKCPDATQKCDEEVNLVFYSSDISSVQEGFRGRVALLDTDLTRKNCGVIINDIRDSDAGYYMFRLELIKKEDGRGDGFNFKEDKVNIVVGALSQRPSVSAPPLTEGQRATLTCRAPRRCSGTPPHITWTWRGTADSVTGIPHNTTTQGRENLTSIATHHLSTLTFTPSAEHHGTNVTCQVTFKGSVTTEATVTLNVSYRPVILPGSGCMVLSEVLTCVCVSRGRPSPLISWLIIEEHSFPTVALGTVVSSITLPARYQLNTIVECVSRNALGEETEKLQVTQKPGQNHKEREGGPTHVDLKTIVAFVIGVIVSATLCCLTWTCHRCRQRIPDSKAEALKMVACGDQKGDSRGAEGGAPTRQEDGPRGGAQRGVAQTGGAAVGHAPQGQPCDVVYASIDYSLLKKKRSEKDAEKRQDDTTETEYSEIKPRERGARQDGGEEGGAMEGEGGEGGMEGEEKEEGVGKEGRMEGEEKEKAEEKEEGKEGEALVREGVGEIEDEEAVEDTLLYSNLKELMVGDGYNQLLFSQS